MFVGNGSDEVIAHAFVALLKQPKPLLFPDVTYSFYPVWAQLFGLAFETVPLDDGMRLRVEDYRREAGSIVIANPNAPTGIALPRAEIARLLEEHRDVPVLIDEAYVDFGGESAVPLIADHPNLLVVQTMSKSRALAGLRVGYALGDVGLIEALRRVKDSFNSYPLGRVAQVGATASLRDDAYFRKSCAQVIAGARSDDAGVRAGSVSSFCRRAQISSSPGIRSGAGRHWRRRCASARCWSGISTSRARSPGSELPSVRKTTSND